ncbi:hypothetical protein AB0M47_04735 [Hamadaea sp. NPDC051192]|uniref:hypothetical protein n=1 Tax=Hamadaea sp. NPDC051192 TaxID=3154940 RepID=UPI0034231D92
MGSSGWISWTSYQQDIEAALQQVRQDAYNRGEHYRQAPNMQAKTMSEEEYVAWEVAEMRRSWDEAFGDGKDPVVLTGPDSLLQARSFRARIRSSI